MYDLHDLITILVIASNKGFPELSFTMPVIPPEEDGVGDSVTV